MKAKISIMSIFISMSLHAVCCCDDPKEVLASEKNSITSMTKSFSSIQAQTISRISEYRSLKKYSSAALLYSSRSFNSAIRLKESVTMKENFEGLAASTGMEAAKIADALTASELRRDVATEAENFSALIPQ